MPNRYNSRFNVFKRSPMSVTPTIAPIAAPKVGFVSLGCPKALVDSEQILTQLRAEGYETRPSYAGADLVIVNTCGFIDAAVQESLDAIGEALAENGKVIVTGCLGAKKNAERRRHHHQGAPEGAGRDRPARRRRSDGAGAPAPAEAARPVHRPGAGARRQADAEALRVPEDFRRLQPPLQLLHHPVDARRPGVAPDRTRCCSEAENLFKAGVKELLVISQDTSAYGVDVKFRTGFWNGRPVKTHMTQLVEALGELAEQYGAWVRLHYVYPYPHVDEVIPLMGEGQGHVLPYLDIPLQHAHPDVLKRMKRPASGEKNLDRIQAWRKMYPDLTIRSTFIAGFPGETEAEFEYLLDFLREAQIDRLGCFAYSPVEGATANELDDPVPEEVREERRARVMVLQEEISAQAPAGQGRQDAARAGRRSRPPKAASAARAPTRRRSTASCIIAPPHARRPSSCKVGEFVSVRITGADAHDLWGEV